MKAGIVLTPYDFGEAMGNVGGSRVGTLPPLAAGYLASALRAKGHDAVFIDPYLLHLGMDETAARLCEHSGPVIGISSMTPMAETAYELARHIKERAPDCLVVLGGPHATSFYDTILTDCDDIDVLVPGDGEVVFAELVDTVDRGEDWRQTPGILYRDDRGEVVTNPIGTVIADLDTLAHPARDIYRNDLYCPLPNQSMRTPTTTMITSRGCSYGRCRFCYQGGKYASKYRRRSPEDVVAEIEELVRDYGVRQINFWDDNFCIGERWVTRFCDLLDEKGIDIVWSVMGRVNTVTESMLKRMAASGCWSVYYGFESGSQDLLDIIDKGITPEQSRQAVRWSRAAGLEIRGSVIFGLPGDTPTFAEQTLRFCCELNVDYMLFFPYKLQPGTPLEETARQCGTILPDTIEMHKPSYLPEGYASADQLERTIRNAYRRYYLRPRYIARTLWRMRTPTTLKMTFYSFAYWLKRL